MTKYTGYVDAIIDGIAYCVMKDESGQEIEGEFVANPDLRERRRFTVTFETIPDKEITPEREAEITAQVEALLGMEDEPQNDY